MAGVYISYPFCTQKCTFCNFASGVSGPDLERRYLAALQIELHATQWPWIPETIYFGGGTPSQMDPQALAALLEHVPGRPWREATVEAAPGTITPEKALVWRRAGINRASLGVQSFQTRELARTGRKHTAETVAHDVAVLRAAGIESINLDLIAGLPGQTRQSWIESLHWIERLDVPHASIYMLEVDDDSRLGKEMRLGGIRYGAPDVPSDDDIADFYQLAVDRLPLHRYEISNFSRPGEESRHNLKYWRREPYLGFGADAHSFDGQSRWQNPESAAQYVADPAPRERIPADPVAEKFFLGLRLSEGIEGSWSPYQDAIGKFIAEGLLESDGQTLRLTPRGVLLSNEVFLEFVA